MNNRDKQIAKLKAQIAKLEHEKPNLKPTGAYKMILKDDKGNVIHTHVEPTKKDAIHRGWALYAILVRKMKQKVSFSIKPEMKKTA